MKRALLFCLLVCACDDQTTAIPGDLEPHFHPDLAVAPSCSCSDNQFCFHGDFSYVNDAGAGLVTGCNPLPTGCSSCNCLIARGGFDPSYCFCDLVGSQLEVDCALL